MGYEYIILGLFALTSGVHLWACYDGKKSIRTVTKILLMPLLLLYYVIVSGAPSIYIIMAIIFAFIGDVLLRLEKGWFFALGALAFMAGHVNYIIHMATTSNLMISKKILISSLLVVIIIGVFGYKTLKDGLGKLRMPILMYEITILSMVECAILYFFANPNIESICTVIGAILFVTSDYLIGRSSFVKKFENKDLIIMATYIFAEFLLVCSFI